MFDVLLINPPVLNPGKVKKIRATSPPTGLLSLAAFLEHKGAAVRILDLALQPELIIALEKEFINPTALVGITSTTNTIGSALDIAKHIKERNPGAFVVFGGPHPSVLPEDVLKHDQVDCVVIGEGELLLYELFSSYSKNDSWKSAEGIAFISDGKLVINPHSNFIEDLDSLPFPARHLVPFKKYCSSPVSYKRLPSTPVITSRGCPYKCTFCSNPVHGRCVRNRSPENIIEELKILKRDYGIRDINFWDDTFTLNKKRVAEICNLLIKEKLDLTWCCASRVDTINPEILEIMKDAGCWLVSFGVESGVERLREKIHKGITEEQIFRAFEGCKKLGIETRAFFMLGLPTETEQDSIDTINFSKKLNPDFLQFTLTVPYPGSALYREAMAEGWNPPDWGEFQTYPEGEPVYVPAGRSGKELNRLQSKAFKSLYFRPAYILKRLRKLRSWDELQKYTVVFIDMLHW